MEPDQNINIFGGQISISAIIGGYGKPPYKVIIAALLCNSNYTQNTCHELCCHITEKTRSYRGSVIKGRQSAWKSDRGHHRCSEAPILFEILPHSIKDLLPDKALILVKQDAKRHFKGHIIVKKTGLKPIDEISIDA